MFKIDLSSVDQNEFNVDDRFIEGYGPVVLVAPSKLKHVWTDSEVHMRSLLCDPDGTIISSGFPKFMNYGEREDLDAMTEDFIATGTVVFPMKMDGSLLIRDVLTPKDGSPPFVHLRTRGCHNLGDFYGPVMKMVNEKYPNLMCPDTLDEMTCLFEYTSPENRIIIQYQEPELTLLGGMILSEKVPRFCFEVPAANKYIAEELGVNPLVFYEFSRDVREIAKAVKGWPDSEGIVVWCHSERDSENYVHMAKIKAWDYIRMHSLKFAFSGRKLRKMCYAAEIESIGELREALFSFGVDWETVTLFRPEFEEYILERRERKAYVEDFLSAFRISGVMELPTRREIAEQTKAYCAEQGEPKMFSVCMSAAVGQEDKVLRLIDAYSLGLSAVSLDMFKEQGMSLFNGLKPFMEILAERELQREEILNADD